MFGGGRFRGRRAVRIAIALAATVALAVPAAAGARNAYVANSGFASNSVSVIDLDTNSILGMPIGVSNFPTGMAITPDGSRVYVASTDANVIRVIDTATNTVSATSIPAADFPMGPAITPDGTRLYVAGNASDDVTAISTATNTVIGAPIPLGLNAEPIAIAITPDGSRAYVANKGTDTVTVINVATNTTIGMPIALAGGADPPSIAITPDGTRAYVPQSGPDTVRVIDLASNTIVGGIELPTNADPSAIAITPDGARAYVTNANPDTVSVLNLNNNSIVGAPIPLPAGTNPKGVALTPDGTRAYVTNDTADNVSVIETATNTVTASPIALPAGASPMGLAIVPNQAPVASFAATPGFAGQPSAFDASGSTDSDGTIARFDWDFGDGSTLPNGGPTPTHTYAAPGAYTVAVTVTDDEGCSTQLVLTGQTVSCNGSPAARAEQQVSVTPDTTPPLLTLSGKKSQRLDGSVEVRASCDEPCTAKGKGTLVLTTPGGGRSALARTSIKLKRTSAEIAVGARTTLKLKLSSKVRRTAAKALDDDGRIRAQISVTGTDAAGNAATKKRGVKLT